MLKNIAIVGVGFLVVVVGLMVYALWETILMLGEMLVYFVVGGLIILAGMGLLFVYNLVNDVVSKNQHEKRLRTLELERQVIEARHSDITVIKAGASEQVFIGSTKNSDVLFKPAHLTPGTINGVPRHPTMTEARFWGRYQELHATAKPQPQIRTEKPAELPATTEALQPILPLLLQSGRLLIGGGSDSGKSNLAKHIIASHTKSGKQIIIVDPHAPSKILGIDVIGAGMDYATIDDTMQGLVELMKSRYEDVKAGVCKHHEHSPLFIVIDELTSIIDNCQAAPQAIKDLLTQSRKVNMTMLLLIHGLDTKTLKVPSGIRSSSTLVWLEGGPTKPYKSFILPDRGLQAKRADWTEYLAVNAFAGYPSSDNVMIKMPDHKDIKISNLTRQGFSNNAICKAVFGGKNGKYLDYIKAVQTQDSVAI